jgi:acetolactate synthase-1/2/3 large subunit
MDAKTPIIVLVWNNRGYGEIKTYMESRGIRPEGVDLTTPDFCAIARAYGLDAERLEKRTNLGTLLKAAAARSIPTLIDVDEAIAMEGL